MTIFFDLETTPNMEMITYLPEIEAPANYKDPAKIGEYITKVKSEQVDKMALDPDLGIINTASICTGERYTVLFTRPLKDKLVTLSDKFTKRVSCIELPDEYHLLNELWRILDTSDQLIGYNILEFDFPYMMRRSLANNVRPTFIPNLAKFQTKGRILDLFMVMNNWRLGKGLKKIRDIYNLRNAYPEINEIKGENIDDQPLEDRLKYAVNDVHLVKMLYKRMLGIYF